MLREKGGECGTYCKWFLEHLHAYGVVDSAVAKIGPALGLVEHEKAAPNATE